MFHTDAERGDRTGVEDLIHIGVEKGVIMAGIHIGTGQDAIDPTGQIATLIIGELATEDNAITRQLGVHKI